MLLSGQIENKYRHFPLGEPLTQGGFCSKRELESRARNKARAKCIHVVPALPVPYLFLVLLAATQKNPTEYTHSASPKAEWFCPKVGFVKAYQSHITNLLTNESWQVYTGITQGQESREINLCSGSKVRKSQKLHRQNKW